MPITDWDAYVLRESSPSQQISFVKNTGNASTGRTTSSWGMSPLGVVLPTSARTCDSTTLGALERLNAASSTLRIVGAELGSSNPIFAILCDRLSDQGGLNATLTTAQTTNLPTAALSRYTDGVGVMMALEIGSQIGATATTASVSYTNDASTSGLTSVATSFGGSGHRDPNRFVILPLNSGDKGVKSVESVTLAATTGTAGNFGVTLFKPLATFVCSTWAKPDRYNLVDGPGGMLTEVDDTACLFWVLIQAQTTNLFTGVVNLAED